MHRLFVAVRPPPEIRARLLSLMGGVVGARWQQDDQLHITLRFVGNVDRHRADDLADALSAIRFQPFPIMASGVGIFERKGQGETLWTGIRPPDGLASLHQKVDRACMSIGIKPDERAYLPHITLARLSRNAGPTDAFIQLNAGFSTKPFLVDSFALFESHLSSAGAIYQMAACYPAEGYARQLPG